MGALNFKNKNRGVCISHDDWRGFFLAKPLAGLRDALHLAAPMLKSLHTLILLSFPAPISGQLDSKTPRVCMHSLSLALRARGLFHVPGARDWEEHETSSTQWSGRHEGVG